MCNDGSGGLVACPDAGEVMGLTEESYRKLQPAARFRRIYVATPGTPGDVVESLREALAAVLQDPEFIQKAEAAKQPVTFLPGAQVTEDFSKEIDLAKEYQAYLRSKL
jgi:hypothetical protein